MPDTLQRHQIALRSEDGDVGADSTAQPVTTSDGSRQLDLSGLLNVDWQKALVIMLTILVAVVLTWVVWQVITPILHTLVLFMLAAVVAFALSGPVDVLTGNSGRRVYATLVVYVLFGSLVLGGIVLLAGPFVSEATALAGALPTYTNDLRARLPEVQMMLGQFGIRTDVDQLETQAVSALEQAASNVLSNLAAILADASGKIVDVLLTLVISVYLLIDGPRFVERGIALIPTRHRAKAVFVQENLARVLGAYIRGQLFLALIVGVATCVAMAALQLPYAVVLGVLAGLFELVPMFGPVLSAIPAVIVALLMPFPTVILVVLFFVVLQQLENNVLSPRITGRAVGLHPLAAMFALLAGYQLAGPLGGLFAVPVAGVLWVVLGAAYRDAAAESARRRPALSVSGFHLPTGFRKE
jgi:predicted PurR-regulated permease PerM